MPFTVHSYRVAREVCAIVGHVAHEDARTFEGRFCLNVFCVFCKGQVIER